MLIVERIVGPGISPNDVNMELPACVQLTTDGDRASFKTFVDTVVKHAFQHASDVLRMMLAETPNAVKLADEFASRLGL